jgi:hypothetical protein
VVLINVGIGKNIVDAVAVGNLTGVVVREWEGIVGVDGVEVTVRLCVIAVPEVLDTDDGVNKRGPMVMVRSAGEI